MVSVNEKGFINGHEVWPNVNGHGDLMVGIVPPEIAELSGPVLAKRRRTREIRLRRNSTVAGDHRLR